MREHPVKLKVLAFLKSSKNLLDRDNPQERLLRNKIMNQDKWLKSIKPEKAYYLTGFADGEGSFNVSLRKRDDHNMGWQVVLTFNVAQREEYILSQFKSIFGCGRIVKRKKDGLHMYVASNPISIQEKVIPFFKRFNFLSQTKKRNFSYFCQIANLVFNKKHLTEDGLKRIVDIREKLNEGRGRKRKYNKNDVMTSFRENPQRLHAKPRAFRKEKHKG